MAMRHVVLAVFLGSVVACGLSHDVDGLSSKPVVDCGELGLPCCDGQCSRDNLTCSDAVCESCGEEEQLCCKALDECKPGLNCNDQDRCAQCIARDTVCEKPDSPTTSFACDGELNCRPCGTVGDLCCPGSASCKLDENDSLHSKCCRQGEPNCPAICDPASADCVCKACCVRCKQANAYHPHDVAVNEGETCLEVGKEVCGENEVDVADWFTKGCGNLQ